MSLFDECGKTLKKSNDHCNSCMCNQFRSFTAGRTVDVILSGVEFTDLVFTCVDLKSCCVTLMDDTGTFIVDCNKIEAIRLLNG
ncbi:penicillin-binding protein [Guptibacillus spartinae]|uniref:penicillin-binding protein n=1 Tax=Guptibacillus spartinae TaxID=3025679 RepID=UPI00235EF054|nr:penicillin-binding protein [Pseudalkalibacillus spartinae]